MQLRAGPHTGYYLSAPVIAAASESPQWKCCTCVKGRWKDRERSAWKYSECWMVSFPLFDHLEFSCVYTSHVIGAAAKTLLCYHLFYLLDIRWTWFWSYMHWLQKLIFPLATCRQPEEPGYGSSQNLIIKSPSQSPESWSITLIFFSSCC